MFVGSLRRKAIGLKLIFTWQRISQKIMITEFSIENYKSIENLSINLGRVNVFIGENGCGKSNILEALVLTLAATQNKLDNEFLTSRGVRVTNPELMRSAFELKKNISPIKFDFTINEINKFEYLLTNDNNPYSKWGIKEVSMYNKNYGEKLSNVIDEMIQERRSLIISLNEDNELPSSDEIQSYTTTKNFILRELFLNKTFNDFLIYSPENTSLRTFEKEGQIEPLGINGEGLFKLLKYFASQPQIGGIVEVKKYLKLFEWFEDFKIPDKLYEGESFLQIKDRFLDVKIEYFDQRSSNEGFLFVLFYFSLLISDLTPNFFAIDNIEASLNPKLCTKLIINISELAKKYNKQIILTTHSPSVLDGLNLNDPEQKLFLVYRNKLGRTKIKQIEKPTPIEGQEPIKLSEAFLRGYIGGLPKNFSL